MSRDRFALDYGGEDLRKIGEPLIAKQTASIADMRLRKVTLKRLKEIEKGERDLYF